MFSCWFVRSSRKRIVALRVKEGAIITDQRIANWITRFSAYCHAPTTQDLKRWLARFEIKDHAVAASVLDSIELMTELALLDGYRNALSRIPGWHSSGKQRTGRWVFAGYGPPAKSGASMLGKFRKANRMTSTTYQNMFVDALQIPALGLTGADTIVFVDDFSGSGAQAVQFWATTEELIGSDADAFLVLGAATATAIARIERETRLKVIAAKILEDDQNIFSDTSDHFSARERTRILHYCTIADKKAPKGYGDCGLLFAFNHTTPNNTIPIIHASNRHWRGCLPRLV